MLQYRLYCGDMIQYNHWMWCGDRAILKMWCSSIPLGAFGKKNAPTSSDRRPSITKGLKICGRKRFPLNLCRFRPATLLSQKNFSQIWQRWGCCGWNFFFIWLLLCRQADFLLRWTRWTRWTRSFTCKVKDGARFRSNWGRVKSPQTLRLVQSLGHAGLGWVLSARGVLANLGSGEKRWRKGSQHESASLARQLVHLRMKRNSRAFQLAC